jgi:hypothetical protein
MCTGSPGRGIRPLWDESEGAASPFHEVALWSELFNLCACLSHLLDATLAVYPSRGYTYEVSSNVVQRGKMAIKLQKKPGSTAKVNALPASMRRFVRESIESMNKEQLAEWTRTSAEIMRKAKRRVAMGEALVVSPAAARLAGRKTRRAVR